MRRLLLLLLLLTAPVHAQEATAQVDRAQVELARSLRLTVEVQGPPGYAPPEAEALQVPPFEVLDAVRVSLPPGEGTRRWRYTLRIAAYETGKLTIPALDLNGARTQPLPVEVTAEKTLPEGQIRGLKAPLSPSSGGWTVAGAAVLGLLTASLLVWLVRKLWPKPRWTPERRFLQALQTSGTPGERMAAMGDAVRDWLAHVHARPLQRKTTREIAQEIDLETEVRQLLEEADLAKFARHEPTEADLQRHLQIARRLC